MNKMKTFQVDETRFDVLKEAYVRALKNFEMEQPHTHATYGAQVLLTEKIWTKEEMLKAATEDDLTASALQLFIPQLLARVQVELFIHGNLTPEKAEDIMKIVESSLGPNVVALPRHAVNRGRQVALESKAVHHHIVENAIHKSSCIVTIFEVGSDQSRRNMLLELFSQIIREPCFNTLRTKEQLGYIVYSGVRKATGIYGLQVIVQSDKKPSYLDSRIENFLKETRELLETMDDEEFTRHKQALTDRRLEKPKKLAARCGRIWQEISSHRYNFNRDEIEVAELAPITKKEVLEFFDTFIAVDAPERKKLSVHCVSVVPKEEGDEAETLEKFESNDGDKIKSVHDFKGSLPLHPLVQPFVDLKSLKRNNVP